MKKISVIKLKNVSKNFKLRSKDEVFCALKNVNLTINRGDNIGIIGNNGAGKTTLLKIISGIIRPSSGELKVRGKVVSIMNLEDGFKVELSGRENIFLNGLLVGMSREEIICNTEKIIDYSGIRDFINEPFYTYSAGMKFRLAFSIAIVSNCDVMIIDEVLTAGDFNFQQKASLSMKKLQRERKELTTIICSHVPDFVWGFSNKYYLMDSGSIEKLNRDEMADIVRKRASEFRKIYDFPEKV